MSSGPNYLWHIDGYDKLKPFGFAIHGGIDGFSRKVLWLAVGSSNNDPSIVATYFVECIKSMTLVPRVVRADRGSENVNIGGIQRFFRRNQTDRQSGNNSFRFGTSTSNQRIESWWSQLRKSRMNWWINYFKDMRDSYLFDGSILYHVECLRFCYIGLIQTELDETRALWNNHRIRQTRNAECPGGRPDMIYFSPTLYGGTDGAYSVTSSDISLAKFYCKESPTFGCRDEFLQLALILMNENGLQMPTDYVTARNLYEFLIREIDSL